MAGALNLETWHQVNDAKARQLIDSETTKLMDELYRVHQTLKPGSAEREHQENHIYERLFLLAELIKRKNWSDQHMRELYHLITKEHLPVPLNRHPVYGDEFKMFVKYPPDVKTLLFLRKLTADSIPKDQMDQLLSDPNKDGQKELLYRMLTNCQRANLLTKGVNHTCSNCWKQVGSNIFFMTIEMLTVEIRARSEQVLEMLQKKEITTQDAKNIGAIMNKTEYSANKLLNQAEKTKRKQDWVTLIESAMKLIVQMINEILMTYLIRNKIRDAVANNEPVEFFS